MLNTSQRRIRTIMTTTYGPYTAVRAADTFLFVSGQVGINPATKSASVDVAEQTNQALINMGNALSESGASLQDVVKTTVFLTDMDDFSAMNTVYEQMFET